MATENALESTWCEMERIFGGSPVAVIVKLAITSIIIGIVLSFFGFNPWNLYDVILRLSHWISSFGIDALESIFRYLVLGAIVVVPLWLLSRLLSFLDNNSRS
jgi:hypothetical protein